MTIDEIPMLSFCEVYAGKICAALDRQHPRDLFDIYQLYQNEGITQEMLDAFVVYLASSDRPIRELLDPNQIDITKIFENEFLGMTRVPVTCEELLNIRTILFSDIKSKLTNEHKEFLLSIKSGEPSYTLLPFKNLLEFPALNWKIVNIKKMDKNKRSIAIEKLKKVLNY